MLGQWALLAIFLGIVVFLVSLPLSSKASHQAETWAATHPKPNWPVFSPTVNENPPVLGIETISISPPERNEGPREHLENARYTRDEDILKPSALLKQKDEREPFYSLANLALQRAFTRSQQLAFQLSQSLKAEDGKWLTLFNVWLECLLFDFALSDSNVAMGDKVHTLFIEAVAIGYTVESKFPIE